MRVTNRVLGAGREDEMGDADKHWDEVMSLARKYGFIVAAVGGTALLATHENQRRQYGEDEYRRIQKMSGRAVE